MKSRSSPERSGDLSLFALVPEKLLNRTRRLAIGRVVSGKPTRIATQATMSESLFEIGSITKAINGLLAADALLRNEISLDQPIREFFPEWSRRSIGTVTLRQLATHTSGLPRLPVGPLTTLRALTLLLGLNPYWGSAQSRVVRSAGYQWRQTVGSMRYSNLGAVVTAELLARAAGISYPELLRTRIFERIGLDHTLLSSDTSAYPCGRSPWLTPTARWRDKGYAAAGGIVASIEDMTKLAEWLLADPDGLAARAFTSIDGSTEGASAGLFWLMTRPDGDRLCWHNGQTGGYSAYFLVNPERGVATIVLSDTSNADVAEQIAFAASKRSV